MAIRFVDGWTAGESVGAWPLPGEPRFAKSRAYDLLLSDLRRYVRDEVPGRSFLIAGHRGSGKTSLTEHAIRVLRSEVILDLTSPDHPVLGRRLRLQRPLLVKLVGQSLVAPLPAIGAEVDTQDPTKVDPVASTLVHVTIALYRALANEIASAFSIHARDADENDRTDRLELAAQLTLELDSAPEPALLRRYWSRLGRLQSGVLWPRPTDGIIRNNAIANQGMREIVALATAAQTFQVCTGAVTYTEKTVNNASTKSELNSAANLKDALQRFGAILAGTATSIGVAATQQVETTQAVGIGLLVWLASSISLGWTGSRKHSSEHSLDYSFIRDRSVQTLDRDLPLVIDRIRDAGLAPVFVIDELDKLSDQDEHISDILVRLKHLVADHGFFCFLTNRNYYDLVEQRVEDEAYPTEHTYFSERVLVLNRPDDLFDYLTGLLTSGDAPAEKLAIATFALVAIFRAKLNFSDLTREVARLAGTGEFPTINPDDNARRLDLRLAATIQLSFNEVLREEPYRTRFENDAAFAQLAADALYYVGRAWQKNSSEAVNLSDDALRGYLLGRMRDRAAQDTTDPNAGEAGQPSAVATLSGPTISPDDFAAARRLVRKQVGLLADFDKFARDLRGRGANDPWRIAEIIPTGLPAKGLLVAKGGTGEYQYKFLLDDSGTLIGSKPDSKWLDGATQTDIAARLGAISAAVELFAGAGLTIDQLVRANVLPATWSEPGLTDVRSDLGAAQSALLETDSLHRSMLLASAMTEGLKERSTLVALVLGGTEMLRATLGEPVTGDTALLAIERYLPLAALTPERPEAVLLVSLGAAALPSPLPLFDSEPVIREFQTGIGSALARLRDIPKPPFGALEIESLWLRWRSRLLQSFERDGPIVSDIDRQDIASAALGRGPGPLFRNDLSRMTIRDWSRILLRGLPTADADAEAGLWVVYAALRQLGFSATSLKGMRKSTPPRKFPAAREAAELEAIDRIVLSTPRGRKGLLVVAKDEGELIRTIDKVGSRPILLLARSEFEAYVEAIEWLASVGVFEGMVDEDD